MTDGDSGGPQSFVHLSEEVRREYAYAALAKWTDIERSLSRSALLMVLLATVFELFNRGVVTKFALSGIELNNARYINVFVLLIFSYQWSVAAELTAEIDWTSRAFEYAASTFLHKDGKWWYGALTPGASIFTALMRRHYSRADQTARITFFFQSTRAVLFIIWPVAFAIYGYVQLLLHYSPIWLVVMSILGSTVQLIFGGFAILSAPDAPADDVARLE